MCLFVFVGQLSLSLGVFCKDPQLGQASVWNFEDFLAKRDRHRRYSLGLMIPYR